MASNWNPANAMTASRFLTLPVFLWALHNDERQIASLTLIVCGALDVFDGAVARLLKCQTPFGEVFDAMADGICYGSMMLMLTLYGWVPWIPVVLILTMGVANLFMRWAYARRAGRTVNYRSYAMERMVAYLCYLIGLGCADYNIELFTWAFPLLMSIVLVHDTKRMLIDPVPAARAPAMPGTGAEVAA
jgi:phosphatidylglycerophosphate synthase